MPKSSRKPTVVVLTFEFEAFEKICQFLKTPMSGDAGPEEVDRVFVLVEGLD